MGVSGYPAIVPQVVVFVAIAIGVVAVWYLMARYVAALARLRDQDEDYWFRMALMVTPMVAWLLLITRTPPSRR
jgi:uncharacterized membrane-anchored protein